MRRSVEGLHRTWNAAARRDSYRAVLMKGESETFTWQHDEFMKTGEKTVEDLLDLARSSGASVDTSGSALDFGCGLGRLTQALAPRFAETHGVDISDEMINQASEINRFGDRCRYHVNRRGDLSIFPSDKFSLVLSLLVLQHMPPALVRRYIDEFGRVLAPGGVLIVGVPARYIGGLLDRGRRHVRLLVRPLRERITRRPMSQMRPVPYERMVSMLNDAGIEVTTSKTVTGPRWDDVTYIGVKRGAT